MSDHLAQADDHVRVGSATHVMAGFSASLTADLDRLLPPASLLIFEEPDVIAARRVRPRCAKFPCVAGVLEAPLHDEDSVASWVTGVVRPPSVQAVIPGVEYGVAAAAALAHVWALPGAGPAAARTLRDKALLRAAAATSGIPQPSWHEVADYEEARRARDLLGGRCVLKPSNRQGSLGVVLLEADDDLAAAWAHTASADEPKLRARRPLPTGFLLEERVDGPEYSVECLVAAGNPQFTNITAKDLFSGPHPVERGHTVPAPISAELADQLTAQTHQLVGAVGFGSGMLHAEWIVPADGIPRLIECAGRIPGDCIDQLIDLAYEGSVVAGLLTLLTGTGQLPPKAATGGAAIRYLDPPHGTLTRITGVEAARTLPGIIELEVGVEPGTAYRGTTSSLERAGHVLGFGPDPLSARARVDAAVAAISMVVEG